MPVTARLSKRFYEVFGEDVTNELVDWFNSVDATYRSDLRELNETNFARFDAKLEQRLAEVRAELRQEIAGLRMEMKDGFVRADARMESVTSAVQSSLQQSHASLLKWMFGTIFAAWATLMGTMITLIKLG